MDADDLINGLPTRPVPQGNRNRSNGGHRSRQAVRRVPQSPRERRRQSAPIPAEPAPTPAEPEPRPVLRYKHYRVPRWLFWTMLAMMISMGWSMHLAERGPDNPAYPNSNSNAARAPAAAATVTVTATETKTVKVEVLPESCRQAVVLMQAIIEDINLLNAKSTEQIDIASDANQAIFQKDWARLRDVQERQRALMQKQQGAYQDYKSKYKPALDALSQCEKDGK